MSIGEIQSRIGQIQAMMLTAAVGPATAPAGTTGTRGAASTGAASVPSTGTDFAAALQSALASAAPAGPTAGGATTGRTPASAAGWVVPTTGQVSSGYGPRWGQQHEGIDIAAGTGTPVRAATGGVVKKAEWYGGYGKAVIIDHGNGVRTLYGHNSALTVKPGDRVEPGQVIAKVGSTGDSTGPHLHFEVEVDGKKVDPRPWLRKHGVQM